MLMPKDLVATFDVHYVQVLDHNGKFDAKLAGKISKYQLQSLLENMLVTRLFGERALKMQRQGKIGT